MARLSHRVLRAGIIAILAADGVAIAAFSVHVDQVTTTTAATPASSVSSPAVPGVSPSPSAVPVGTPPVGSNTTPVVLPQGIPSSVPTTAPTAPSSPLPSHAPSPTAHHTPSPVSTPTTPSRTTPPTVPQPAAKSMPPCPIKLTTADASGGLQSLIPFAPAFGPLEPEAFAAAAAYQPVLQLVGPILAQYPELEPTVGPAVNTFVTDFGGLLDTGFSLVAPAYDQIRPQVLADETQLAAALAPYSEQLADSTLGGCVTELENALIADASGSGTTPAATATPARTKE